MILREKVNLIECIILLWCSINVKGIFCIKCDDLQWDCDSGTQCIDIENRCDGKQDCNDNSDEIAENCIEKVTTCRKLNFICTYGACVPLTASCNGVIDCADGSDELPALCNTESWRQNLQGKCQDYEIQCVSGECISSEDICDGHPNCSDGSDETLEVCSSQPCPPQSFRCGYGACVSGSAVCNNTEECADGSDESGVLCARSRRRGYRPSLITTNKLCQIPRQGPHMTFRKNDSTPLAYGQVLGPIVLVNIACTENFTLEGYLWNFCVNGEWQNSWPQCFQLCSDVHPRSGYSTKATFSLNGVDVSHKHEFKPETIATFSCSDGFNKPWRFIETSICRNGIWTAFKQRCEMDCGKPVSPFTTFSIHGADVNITEVPWHVGIYFADGTDFTYICAGSLISPRRVITAAHCFFSANEIVNPTKHSDGSPFWVAAGKYYKDFNHDSDTAAVKRQVINVWIPYDFKGKKDAYYHDVSILHLNDFVPLSDLIRPVCVISALAGEQYVESDLLGHFAAWNSLNRPNSSLQQVSGSTISYAQCKDSIFNRAKYKISPDKFCVSLIQNTINAPKVCKGDSGSGFVLWRNDTKQYTLYGVISFADTPTQDCSLDGKIVITNVLGYETIFNETKIDLGSEIKYT